MSVAVAVERAHGIGRIGGQDRADIYGTRSDLITAVVGVSGVATVATLISIADAVAIAIGRSQ